jgi:hypothetical protein
VQKSSKEERERKKGKISLSQEILMRLKNDLKNMPIVLEMMCHYYGVNSAFSIDDIIEIVLKMRDSDPIFYEINIGSEKASLLQEKHMASRDRGTTNEPMYQAWAIKFTGVYGLDIYFIPYTKKERGFAITVFDLEIDNEDEAKTFFPHDIYKKFAINTMSKYV